MTADVNVTEKVAKRLFASPVSNQAARTAPEIMALCDEAAREALAALADPEVQAGIAGVLREHGDSRQSAGGFLLVCRCGEAVDDHGAHQARAVVEWLRGRV